MKALRITQSAISTNEFRVELIFEGDGVQRQTATAVFDFTYGPQDREGLRWYLEDYLQHAADPAPQIAERIERRIGEIGSQLFQQVFESSKTAELLWARLQESLNEARIEIVAEVQEATTIPWELLRNPVTETYLALETKAFVRTQTDMTRTPKLPCLNVVAGNRVEPIRILLVICRPSGGSDAPFRSVASCLIKGLGGSGHEAYQLDMLRPPTFSQLGKVLRNSKSQGRPYHIVHFDGHGTYADAKQAGGLAAILPGLGSLILSAPRAGTHGYLLFENPEVEGNVQLVDGPALGKLLAETDVPVLVLNACRSAHAEAPIAPETATESAGSTGAAQQDFARQDTQMQVKAYGSLAQEIVNAGVNGVVAMRYNVYVVTAAQFVADLYESLVSGQTLGEAVTLSRKQLETQPLREIAYSPRPLQDWMVPIVYEAMPFALFPKSVEQPSLRVTLVDGATAPITGELSVEFAKRPDAGFFGRDETLLALDRAFDTQAIVLLHAYAGSGKTSTAIEFARWYQLTGGITGPLLFTSFDRHKPLAQVLNESVGRVYGSELEQSGIHWLALTDEQRRQVALQVLTQVPVLWVWDNVEPIAGFPEGAQSAWSDAEQQMIANFLRTAGQTKAKFLLTSRRDERSWLGDLPARIQVPPMPMQERVQLVRAFAEKQSRRLTEVEDWMPLLRFTDGNPLTITVLVGQALRDGLKTKAQIEAFVSRLRDGEKAFEDEASEGRTKSLGVSLSYGFDHAFSEVELKQLALLYLFQSTVNVGSLCKMGKPDADWCVPEARGITREAATTLLDRATEVGILTNISGGYYSIHPALPWFLKGLFDRYYSQKHIPSKAPVDPSINRNEQSPIYAYVCAINEIASAYERIYTDGDWHVAMFLNLEESNLLHALQFARSNRWYHLVINIMNGLKVPYSYGGRSAEWKKQVVEILPSFHDENTGMAKPGLRQYWRKTMEWRVQIALEEKDSEFAENVLKQLVVEARNEATEALNKSKETWTADDRQVINYLAVILNHFGILRWQSQNKECVSMLNESFDLSIQLDDPESASDDAFHLGHAYMDIREICDLNKAETWYEKSIELMNKDDSLRYSIRLHELGQICYGRFIEIKASGGKNQNDLSDLVKKAIDFCEKALNVLPDDATYQPKYIHHLLGNIYDDIGYPEMALEHYRTAIRLCELRGDLDFAATVCREVARCFFKNNQLDNALDYAKESLRKLQKLGSGANADVVKSNELIATIEYSMRK